SDVKILSALLVKFNPMTFSDRYKMTDEVIQSSAPVTEHVSTALESDVTPKTSGGGKIIPAPVEEAKPEAPAKAESVRDSLKAELDKAKEPEKVEKPVKAEKLEEEPKPVAKTEVKSATPEKEVDASEQVKDQQTERKSE